MESIRYPSGDFLNIHPFLAVTDRVNSKVLVIEGWIQRHAIQAGADEFNRGSYERIFTTGGPENGSGGYVNDYQTSASVGVEALKEAGIPEEVVQMAPSHVIDQERTYSAAIALRDWLREHNITVQSMNVLTEDAHARRTQLLYRKAFGKKVLVGIIAVSNPDDNPKYWWRYSDGVREVIGESIAYIYARFLFYPPASLRDKKMTQASQHPADTQQ
ncbi:MAG: cytosine deaminase [Verrucomicrobia bacterium]|nr:MAG: cytosine deaminase [Verrucomicrobiota bacterium]